MQKQIDNWLETLSVKSNQGVTGRTIKYVLEPGRKYVKVVREEYWASPEGSKRISKSVHAFIEVATGDIYKAASWKAPAKNGARFNIVFDHDELIAACDPYGSYLYKR